MSFPKFLSKIVCITALLLPSIGIAGTVVNVPSDQGGNISHTQVDNVITPPIQVYSSPTPNTDGGLTSVGGGSGAVSFYVVRNTTVSANIYSVRAANVTATAGTVILYANTGEPASGALNTARIYGCKHIAANGDAEWNFTMPLTTALGMTLLVSSATDCTTYTKGVITATFYAQAK